MSSTAILSYLVLSISVVYAFIMPFIGNSSRLLGEKARYQEALDQVSNIEAKKNALETEFKQISAAQINKVETLIPSSLNFVKLIADIDAAASKYGISIDKVSSTNNSSAAGSISETQNIEDYNSATISFEFASTYTQFNDFLNDLEKSLRILDIKSIQITTGENTVYTYKLSLSTYWSK